jgi:hypothetical protein
VEGAIAAAGTLLGKTHFTWGWVVLRLPEELEAFRAELHKAVEKRIVPLGPEIERTKGVVHELLEIVRDLEITQIPFSSEVGGSDGPTWRTSWR